MGTITTDVMQYFESHSLERVYLHVLASETEHTKAQCMNALSAIMRLERLPGLHKLTKSGPWVYSPNAEIEVKENGINFRDDVEGYVDHVNNSPRIPTKLEVIGVTRNGELILQGNNDALYRAVEL